MSKHNNDLNNKHRPEISLRDLRSCANPSQSTVLSDVGKGYSRGSNSLMEAILKNQLRQVSLAVSLTSSTVNDSK